MKKTTFFLFFILSSFLVSAQNDCTSASTIVANTIYSVGVFDGTPVTSSCFDGNIGNNGEWYTYTPTTDATVTVTTDLPNSAGKDTRIQVYNGSGGCAGLVCIGGDDDSATGFLSTYTFNVTNGTTYYIVFDNYWVNNTNNFDFRLTEAPIVVSPITFTSSTLGATGQYKNCVVDMNNDYLDDIVTVDNNNLNIHYQQAGGGFTTTNIATATADDVPSWSIAAGDFNKDGFNDLLYGGGNGATFVASNATGTAYTVTSNPEYIFSQRSNFVDINNDGHLDAFVCHDVDPNVYYLNNGVDNTLVYNQGGLGDSPTGGNYASSWVDYDNDGDVDLFLAKCNGGGASADARHNEMHRNNGDGTFTDVSIASGLRDPIQTWSSAWGDYDNDGDLDLFVGASSFIDGQHKLMTNNNDGTFTDSTTGTGLDTFTGTSIEHITHDFDNDGFLDLFTADNTIMLNNQDMTFTAIDVGFSVGAVGDLNNDGFLDVYNSNDRIYMNDGNSGHNWVKINTQGVQSNSNGIGARVEVYTANLGMQIRDVITGNGFRHMSSLTTHFGLGSETAITQIIIKWPSGITDTITNPGINQTHNVIEGSTLNVLDFILDNKAIYPNPTTDFIQITDVDLSDVTTLIFDINGRRVYNFKIENNAINVSHLASGTYFLTLQEGNKLLKHQFIKK
ncbi:FG-GAP-like repeat-containing protein [Pseudofulvibacter geojedonensis]|uniref:FG-GAP-like repeat-containing protein n=1 Tax=Pseudofulvibacter geojedonensis TaxID=1123758 RepID=A0ABW3I045_9FLAO